MRRLRKVNEADKKESTLHLTLRPRSGMQIFLKTATGKTAFEVESNDTMENVEAKIYNEKDFLPGQQHKIPTVKQF